MDGFKPREYIFVLGATNASKNLDPAALRPGRFDKLIHVPLPDKKGRVDIFDLYLKKIKLPVINITSDILSKMTPGFTGAEIENMVNMAVIQAVDTEKPILTKEEFEDARDRVILGIKRKSKTTNVKSTLQTAIHEAGHALVCYNNIICRKGIHKVTIATRGNSKGATSTLLDDMQGTREEFVAMIDMALAGLLAEEIYFENTDKVGSGCGKDYSRATSLAKSMVTKYAMDTKFGYMVVEDDYNVHKISGTTRNTMDNAVNVILKSRHAFVKDVLINNVSKLKTLSQQLILHEELNKEQLFKIMNGEEIESLNINNDNAPKFATF